MVMTELALTRARILDAAMHLAEREGLRALNMRRLAAELGVGTMSLYYYVTDKEALLEAIAEAAIEPLAEPPDDLGWVEAITVIAQSFRAIALRHPAVFPLLVGPRTPAAISAASAQTAAVLRRRGFDNDTTVLVLRVVVRFLIGWCLVETSADPAGLRPALSRDEADRQFEFALAALLRGLNDSLAVRRTAP